MQYIFLYSVFCIAASFKQETVFPGGSYSRVSLVIIKLDVVC